MDLYETVTHDVYRSTIEDYEIYLGTDPLKNSRPKKLPIFDDFATQRQLWSLRANISGEKHDMDKWETALETTKDALYRPKIAWTLVH